MAFNLNSIFNKLKSQVKNEVTAAAKEGAREAANKKVRVALSRQPETLEELKSMPEADLLDPNKVAALTVAVLDTFSRNREECYKMLAFLKGPQPLTEMEKQQIRDRNMDGATYIARSYYVGATPENDYTPSEPRAIIAIETPYSDQEENYKRVYMSSGGADSLRYVLLRRKPSTGQWFLWEQYLLVGIRKPKSQDAWA